MNVLGYLKLIEELNREKKPGVGEVTGFINKSLINFRDGAKRNNFPIPVFCWIIKKNNKTAFTYLTYLSGKRNKVILVYSNEEKAKILLEKAVDKEGGNLVCLTGDNFVRRYCSRYGIALLNYQATEGFYEIIYLRKRGRKKRKKIRWSKITNVIAY